MAYVATMSFPGRFNTEQESVPVRLPAAEGDRVCMEKALWHHPEVMMEGLDEDRRQPRGAMHSGTHPRAVHDGPALNTRRV